MFRNPQNSKGNYLGPYIQLRDHSLGFGASGLRSGLGMQGEY